MLCCICKERKATVFLSQIVGDKLQKVDLCEECARNKGVSDPAGCSLADLLMGLGASQEMETAGADLKCPRCGFTHAEFKKSGRLGCAECYSTFFEGLEGLLKTMHKGTRHVGKVPLALQQSRDQAERLKSLRKKLEKAVEDENFEQAALLRDEIKKTSAKSGGVAAIGGAA